MNGLSDSQQSFQEVWTSSFPKPEEKLFPELENVMESHLDSDVVFDQKENPEDFSYLDDLFLKTAEPTQASLISSENIYLTDFPGSYGFELDFEDQSNHITKSTNFTYSQKLNKLFVRMGQICPIKFKCSISSPLSGCVIRTIPLFKKPEHYPEVVEPCLNHKAESKVSENSDCHFVHVDMPPLYKVIYSKNAEDRGNVACLSMLSNADYSILRYKFTCLSSCRSGINKRPVMLAFILESPGGILLGHRSIDLSVCTCPGRDRIREEKKLDKSETKIKLKRPCSSSVNPSSPKHPRTSNMCVEDNDEVFTMTIKGREKYERLLKIKEAFDLAELTSPEQQEEYYLKESELDNV